jgi:hypothetical protein
MPEHYTKGTVSATFWCRKCWKATLHAVHDGRRGRCYDCTEKMDEESRARAAAPAPTRQPEQSSFEFTAAAPPSPPPLPAPPSDPRQRRRISGRVA